MIPSYDEGKIEELAEEYMEHVQGDTRRNSAQQILSLSQKPKPDAAPDTLTRASRRLCVDQTSLVSSFTHTIHPYHPLTLTPELGPRVTPDPVTPLNQVMENNNPNNTPSLQDQILSRMSSLEALIKQHNERVRTPIVTPIRLTFHDDGDGGKRKDGGKSPRDGGDEDLKKPYKED
ncbi:hypothetical protein Tco_1138580 [Tanacetum coccineum]